MSRVRDRDSLAERTVRSLIHKLGYRFRLHRKDLPGSPDIVLPKFHSVVFVHGCFWHKHEGCKRATLPKTNRTFWRNKLDGNVERDKRVVELLQNKGWRVLLVWECETKKSKLPALQEKVTKFIQNEDEA